MSSKKYMAKYNRRYYKDNKERLKFTQRIKHNSRKLEMLDLHGTTSCPCGESRHWCLCFHHRNADEKSYSIAVNTHRTNEALKRELSKCDVLCHNCHANLHYEEN